MKKINFLGLFFVLGLMTSCLGTKDVKYLQTNENLEINSEGLVPYNVPIYRVKKNDILRLNIVTTPKGDAAQFYSSYNTQMNNWGNNYNNNNENHNGNFYGGGGNYYFTGLKVNYEGEINIFGIGLIKAEGRVLDDIAKDIQERVNENFLEGKSEVRLNIDGIRYYVLGDIETTGMTGEKVAYKHSLSITEALAMNGGLNRTVDRKNVKLLRKYPEGIKMVNIDLTREDIVNSPYYWIQNGDEIYLNTRKRNFHGFGKEPIQTLTTGASLITSVLSIYYIFSRL